jgi:inhibitor of KinA sporulation pathway (predicted exonuclease)
MATTINEPKQIVLIDGTVVNVRPLKISLLRSFMKKFEKIAEVADDNDKSMNLLIECVQIAMQQYAPEIAADAKALEDNIDLPTVYKIVEEASGVKLSDTSLMGGLTA